MRQLNSTVWRILALHGVAIAVASIALPLVLADRLHATAATFERRLLQDRLSVITHTLSEDPAGRLALPAGILETVRGDGSFGFRVLDKDGGVLLSAGPVAPRQPTGPPGRETYFEARGRTGSFTGVEGPVQVGGRTFTVQVVQNLDFPDVVIDDVEAVFLSHLAWMIGAVLLALFALDIVVVRAAMGPISRASHDARTIDTARLDVRLAERGLPSEVRPLVRAINKALDRLERGFRLQRDFTADVAHELRTPLSVMRLRVDALGDRRAAEALQNDLEVMARVVDQLLALAELEAAPLETEAVADLHAVAERVVRHLAPAAIARKRELALTGALEPNPVRAGPGAVFQALRNLVENALQHTPEGAAVEVRLEPGGIVRVLDEGPGVADGEEELIFERFWRSDRQRGSGAGLGLAIVARIAAVHGGSVDVRRAPGGGADFVLRFEPAAKAQAEME
jgi:signal transduction histidine kinase